jgi:D-3-phosphoglycerate dehydrogenase
MLGRAGINVRYMSVAGLESEGAVDGGLLGEGHVRERSNEALMLLGVQGAVGRDVEDELRREEGILDVSVVWL